jgi:aminopeptidase N
VQARGRFDADARTWTLELAQANPPTPGQDKSPVAGDPDPHGPAQPRRPRIAAAAAGRGRDAVGTERVLVLDQAEQSFTFVNIDEAPVASLLRQFSAPVVLDDGLSDAQLLTLLANDPDPFNRWEAGQRLGLRAALHGIAALATDSTPVLNDAYIDAMRSVLRNPQLDAAFKELVLTLPSETYIAEQLAVVDPQRVHLVREAMRAQLATALFADWEQAAYEENHDTGAYTPDPTSSGRRALAGMALNFLCLAARVSGDTVWPGKTPAAF